MHTSTSVTQATKSQPFIRKRVRNFDSLGTLMKEMRSMIELCVGSMDKRMGKLQIDLVKLRICPKIEE